MFANARRTRAFVAVVGALAVVCALPTAASASPGQIDPTFGHSSNGTVFADYGRIETVVKVLHQTDGKIVTVASDIDPDFAMLAKVTRYTANGSLDTTFATGGVFTLSLVGNGAVSDAVLQPDGKIVLGGTNGVPEDFFVTRLRTNGTVDPTFVTAHPTTNFGGASVDQAFGVALGPAGTIVLAGRSGQNVAIARYTTTGALDPTFSGDGLVTHDFGGQSEAQDVAVQADGRIIITGSESPTAGSPRILVARFTAVGGIDGTYGTGGRVATAGSPLQSVHRVLLQAGKAVVAGIIDIPTAGISRYNANGTLDTTFGSAGTARAHVNKFTRLSDLVADGSGRLIGVGSAAYSDDFPDVPSFAAIFRYSANGAPDTSFGCFGMTLTEMLGNGAGTNFNASVGTSAAVAGNDILLGGFAETFNGTDFPPADQFVARYDGDGPHTSGYGLLRGDGGTSAFGGAPACGSTAGLHLNQPIVGIAYDNAAPGNWTVASDGGVFTFGAAKFLGSMGGVKLNQPIVGMASTPDGKGYWLVARDGGIFAFGTAQFFGSMGGIKLNKPVVGMAAATDGKGYWLVATDGGVFSFGSAKFAGSTGNIRLNKPVVGIAADRDGKGYWIVATDGGVFSFDAKFAGSTGNIKLAQPVVGIAADPDGTGYWMAARDGGLFAFAATFNGSNGATPFPVGSSRSTIAIAATP
ncbi:MAG: hypothetical protein QOJ71_3104 [Actinomycetota bacterium]|nr:hypothetical protein [Actinomycetota bacterium]